MKEINIPFGHSQNQPNLLVSMASMKYLHTISVVVRGFPALEVTTRRSFSSSHLSIVSICETDGQYSFQ
jgi:hypothetical protein